LTRTRDQLDELLAWSAHERPGATALLEHILGLEAAHKLEQRITRRIDTSGLVERKSLEAFDWDFQPSLDKSLVLELARLDFVRRHDDLVITGNNGTGKSHLLKAFALRACEQGLHMRYARCVDLLEDLHVGCHWILIESPKHLRNVTMGVQQIEGQNGGPYKGGAKLLSNIMRGDTVVFNNEPLYA
jgi:DNA replication protein DnaC